MLPSSRERSSDIGLVREAALNWRVARPLWKMERLPYRHCGLLPMDTRTLPNVCSKLASTTASWGGAD